MPFNHVTKEWVRPFSECVGIHLWWMQEVQDCPNQIIWPLLCIGDEGTCYWYLISYYCAYLGVLKYIVVTLGVLPLLVRTAIINGYFGLEVLLLNRK